MVEELYMTQWFSKEMIVAGESLVERLEESNASVQAAFWKFDEEEKQWELVVVSPLVESEGPRNYYKRVYDCNKTAKPTEEIISLHNIRVLHHKRRMAKAMLSSETDSWANSLNKRLGKRYIADFCFDDLYIYRLNKQKDEKLERLAEAV